jgi:hypothetical protein
MRRLLFLLVSLALSLIAGCTSSSSDSSGNYQGDNSAKAEVCPQPVDPYIEGSGHYAGYEWAEQHGSPSCNNASQSFVEGCEEYETQESEYEECEARKK